MGRKAARGFTILEFLIVVVIVAILVAVAIPHFTRQRTTNSRAALMGDLDRLAAAERSYFQAHRSYTADLKALGFAASSGVRVSIDSASGTRLRVTATSLPAARRCVLSMDSTATPTTPVCAPYFGEQHD